MAGRAASAARRTFWARVPLIVEPVVRLSPHTVSSPYYRYVFRRTFALFGKSPTDKRYAPDIIGLEIGVVFPATVLLKPVTKGGV